MRQSWSRQLSSDLADTFRLVTLELRGHGLSEKPLASYGDSQMWRDDVHAVIRVLDLDHPVLCGWSYGPLVISITSVTTARTVSAVPTSLVA
jgi:pimeloyl-ACP methyl ester carboxylesterase